jgi:hypothetical protein
MLETTTLIEPDDAATVSQLLGDIGQGGEAPGDIDAARPGSPDAPPQPQRK